jgi:hypothetical protein
LATTRQCLRVHGRQSLRDRIVQGRLMPIAIHTPDVPKTLQPWRASLEPQIEASSAPLFGKGAADKVDSDGSRSVTVGGLLTA